MRSEDLEIFLVVARERHFSRAGQVCHASGSAITRSIQRLEEELGERLFERDNRQVNLTDVGQRFLPFASEVLSGWQQQLQMVEEGGKVLSGELSIYASLTAASSILPAILSEFRKLHPGVLVRLQTGDAAAAMVKITAHEADLSIAALPDRMPNTLIFQSLLRTPIVFVAARENIQGVNVQDWREYPLILPEKGLARQRFDQWCKANPYHFNIYAEVSGNEAILALVSMGCGLGFVPKLVLERHSLRENLVVLEPTPLLGEYVVGLCYERKREKERNLQAFMQVANRIHGYFYTKGAKRP